MTERISVLDTDWIRALVSAVDDAGDPVDLSGQSVSFAFLPGGTDPTDGDWLTGEWSTTYPGPEQMAKVYVGPGGVGTVDPGTVAAWWRSGDSVKRYGYYEFG